MAKSIRQRRLAFNPTKRDLEQIDTLVRRLDPGRAQRNWAKVRHACLTMHRQGLLQGLLDQTVQTEQFATEPGQLVAIHEVDLTTDEMSTIVQTLWDQATPGIALDEQVEVAIIGGKSGRNTTTSSV